MAPGRPHSCRPYWATLISPFNFSPGKNLLPTAGEGNIFNSVCLSTGRGLGRETPTLDGDPPPDVEPLSGQTETPYTQRSPLLDRHLVAATAASGTHPTGMHSCIQNCISLFYPLGHFYSLLIFIRYSGGRRCRWFVRNRQIFFHFHAASWVLSPSSQFILLFEMLDPAKIIHLVKMKKSQSIPIVIQLY